MTKYEVVLVKYPDDVWWTAICLAMRGCVSDGESREEALNMIADAMALYLEEEPGWEVVVLDGAQLQAEKEATIAECRQRGGATEIHWVEPRRMPEEEWINNPRFEGIVFPIV